MEVPESREVPADCSPPKCASLDGMSALQAQQGPTATEFRYNSRKTSVPLDGMSALQAKEFPCNSWKTSVPLDGMSALQAQQGPTATECCCSSRGACVLLVGMSAQGAQQGPSASGIEVAVLGKRSCDLPHCLENRFRGNVFWIAFDADLHHSDILRNVAPNFQIMDN